MIFLIKGGTFEGKWGRGGGGVEIFRGGGMGALTSWGTS